MKNGPALNFPTTHWTLVSQAAEQSDTSSQKALEQLCEFYWQPLYQYSCRHSNNISDAQDITQEFFLYLFSLEKPFANFCEDKGSFRAWLLKCFVHFLAKHYRKQNTAKRGGKIHFLAFDELLPDDPALMSLAPEESYDRAWGLHLIARVRQQLRLCARDPALFVALERHLPGGRNAVPLQKLSEQFGLSEGTLKVRLHRLRRRFAATVRAELRHIVQDEEQMANELRALAKTLSAAS